MGFVALRLNRIESKLAVPVADITVFRESLDRCEKVLQSMIGQRLDSEDLRFEPLSPVDFVADVCQKWSVTGRAVKFNDGGGVRADWLLPKMLLSQTLVDMLSNAHQALASVSSLSPILVDVREAAGVLEISIVDEGPGFPAAIRPHLGQPFVTSKTQGTGLGLFNANNLCVALGGSVTIADREEGGTRVLLRMERGGDREGGR